MLKKRKLDKTDLISTESLRVLTLKETLEKETRTYDLLIEIKLEWKECLELVQLVN